MGWESVISFVQNVLSFFLKKNDSRIKKLNDRKISAIIPKDIISRSDAAPEFSRKEIEKSFKGIKIQWQVKFIGIVDRKLFGTRGTVLTSYNGNNLHWISMKLTFDDFPEIKIAQKNEAFDIIGIITKVDGTTIYVKPLSVERNNFFVF